MGHALALVIILIFIFIWYRTACSYQDIVKTNFRRLWVDHGVYTRLYIVSYLNSLPDADLIAARLMKNQENIGNAVSQIYGQRKGDPLIPILKAHIAGAAQILKDLKTGSSADADIQAWYQNGDDLAKCLTNLFKRTSYQKNQSMIKKHLDLTIQEVQEYLNDQYEQSLRTFDLVMDELMMMSDYLVS
jgi:hypothetical protein